MAEDPLSAEVAERRGATRRALESPVRMRIEVDTLEGMSDNISTVGLMFFTDEPLRVTVEIGEPGGTRTYSGRLVRVQRMNDTNTGLAVEFDS